MELSIPLYGEESQVLNMHSLKHLSDDVKSNKCCLSDITAYSFESYLGKLKRYLRSGNKPLSQLCSRLEEEYLFENTEVVRSTKPIVKTKKLQDRVSIKEIQLKDCCLTTRSPDNIVLLENDDAFQILEIYSLNKTNDVNNIYLKGKKLEVLPSNFNYPCNFENLQIFKVKINDSNKDIEVSIKDVQCKMLLMTIYELPEDKKDSWVAPLLHM